MCSQWNEKLNNIHWANSPTQSKSGDSSVWKSCPAHQNSMVHLTSSRFLPLLFPKTPHYLVIWLNACPWNGKITYNSCMAKHGVRGGRRHVIYCQKTRSASVTYWQKHWLCHMAMPISSMWIRIPAFRLCNRWLSDRLGDADRAVGLARQPAICKDPYQCHKV